MATLTITAYATGYTTADIGGMFEGGDTGYSYQRFVRVTITGWGSTDIYSAESSGGYNTFSATITGLTQGTTYSWTATLYYKTTGGWAATSYTDSGTFSTPAEERIYYGYLVFDTNGGTGGPSASASASVTSTGTGGYVTCTIPTSQPTRSGYTFAGWAANAAGTGTIRYPGGTCTIYATATTAPGTPYTLYAAWTETTSGCAYIYSGGTGGGPSATREKAVAYIYSGGTGGGPAATREKAVAYVYYNGGWKKGT